MYKITLINLSDDHKMSDMAELISHETQALH